jgi:F0F1-type ATP synthase assembly protein I
MSCAVRLDQRSSALAQVVYGAGTTFAEPIGDRVADNEPSPERGPFAMFGTLTGIAALSAVLVVGGAGLGLLVDDWTSAPHVFVFVGLVLGVLAAFMATRSIVRQFFR